MTSIDIYIKDICIPGKKSSLFYVDTDCVPIPTGRILTLLTKKGIVIIYTVAKLSC